MKPKSDIGIFIDYSELSRGFRIYNHRTKQISPISNDEAGKLVQEEDSTDLNKNTLLSPYHTLMFEEAESSSTAKDPLNMQVITLVQPSTHIWTKAHPLDQVIGDPLGQLQVHQSPSGIFISQSQYEIELLKKHGMDECDSKSTPMATARLDVNL
ncbi:hypothetical protein Tco_0012670 [Tanacetum coccineum]